MNTRMIDWISIKLQVATVLLGIFSVATQNQIVFYVSVLAGISTILYNVYRYNKDRRNK